jgi:broad specificity phosphatase PhoE
MTASSLDLVFVRHGRTIADEGRCIGSTDVELSAEGMTSIRALATGWHTAGSRSVIGEPTRIIASDLRRAADSARVFGLLWNRDIELDRRVREMDFGVWDGQLWGTIEASDTERFRAWSDRWTEIAPPGGEPMSALADRASDWLRDIRSSNGRHAQTVVAVTHAGLIRVAVAQLLGRSLVRMFDIPVDYGHATIVRIETRRNQLIALNTSSIP